MSEFAIDMEAYQKAARQAVAEGCVLLRNEHDTLPVKKGERVAVFGRTAADNYKSGLGSGGMVNTRYVVSILDALLSEETITVDQQLVKLYADWNEANPPERGLGWGNIPWNRKEMPLEDKTVADAANRNDLALIIIGRTAGEDQDNTCKPGSYLLTDLEKDMIGKACRRFERVAVLLNVGNIIDMSWVEELSVPCAMYVWQGGQEGGKGVADALLGRVNPCGKLTDTIAANLKDYPSDANFGDTKANDYVEDIYVGYRYFETFAKDRVVYPFGFGLSYTTFAIKGQLAASSKDTVSVDAEVTNTGACTGKEVLQLYVKAPQGKLGKAERTLIAFEKTHPLKSNETVKIHFDVCKYAYASFDDSGVTGHKNAYVLEAGTYEFYLGSDVRSASLIGTLKEELTVVEQLEEAMAPVRSFKRMKAEEGADGSLSLIYEDVPLRTVDMTKRMTDRRPADMKITGDRGIRLEDVYDGRASLDDFIAQLSPEEMIFLFRGEGMSSPKVTPGTGSAFGGLCPALTKYGIPAGCTTDGPSGLRMDCGTKAFSLPNGTSLGCTFNMALVKELYSFLGKELRRNRVDALLGPGMNIHRHPLNGRNFEYISEDPLLTGKIAAAMTQGISCVGPTGTIKHFCANNQEFHRKDTDGRISQRALREIYLKGFEIAVREGNVHAVMTTYGAVNGLWTASDYDLCTTILRGEWGFDGMTMTDWWANGSEQDTVGTKEYRSSMITAGNDTYMVNPDQTDHQADNVMTAFEEGRITIGQLQENTRHILGLLLRSPAMLYQMGRISQEELDERAVVEEGDVDFEHLVTYEQGEDGVLTIDHPDWKAGRGDQIDFTTHFTKEHGIYSIRVTAHSDLNDLAQLPVTISYDTEMVGTLTFRGSNGRPVQMETQLGVVFSPTHYIRFYYGADGLIIDKIEIYWTDKLPKVFEELM